MCVKFDRLFPCNGPAGGCAALGWRDFGASGGKGIKEEEKEEEGKGAG